ncbi:MAG: HD domain-containing protein [Acholeplasmatales bacterium]|nr:HD domain-containing protein [Acholeplasmatales bacterium]
MNYFDIYTMKLFNRLRNKAQMFSSLADDHYHTRLMHSLEVNDIAIAIVKRLKEEYASDINVQKLDETLISNIALLHDIGHTPYGHIGERTLHNICSGETKLFDDVNFKELGIACGFKHNINSGLLYKEYLVVHKKEITDFECKVCDGVMKHTAIYYKNQDDLDYGFRYVVSGMKGNNQFDIKYDSNPGTNEGLIVSFADEIAQVSSDYIDLKTCEGENKESDLDGCLIFRQINEKDMREKAKLAANILIDSFVKDYSSDNKKENYENSNFIKMIKNFDMVRSNLIRSNNKIRIHDQIKEAYIEQLYAYYFENPLESNDLLIDFIERIKYVSLSDKLRDRIDIIINNNSNDKEKEKELINSFVKEMLRTIYEIGKKQSSIKYSINDRKDFIKIGRTYVRSVAIDISKMTDGYADHKIKKLTKPFSKK